ncbi:MAG: hypothetical protein AAGF01_24550 [Cyanobacteria bacterium P01_G01_bin.38]
MRVRWRKLGGRTLVWLAAELLLTLIGVDDLADYIEYLLERQKPTITHRAPVWVYAEIPEHKLNICL